VTENLESLIREIEALRQKLYEVISSNNDNFKHPEVLAANRILHDAIIKYLRMISSK